MFTPVPVVVLMVLVAPVTFTVPPPVALKAALAPELTDTLVKLNVELVLVPVKANPAPPVVVKPVKLKVLLVTLDNNRAVPVVVVTATSLTVTDAIEAA
jgi:hypothetical protein